MTARVQRQIKQIWLKDEDDANAQRIAEYLRGEGVDVDPDNKKAQYPYSHSKVIRWALAKIAADLRGDDEDTQ